jgi:ornithine carbamoyltransferase
MRHLLTLFDLSATETREILALAKNLKHKFQLGERKPVLTRKSMALLFEKQSMRTRVSFESGMTHLGGSSMFLGEDVGWGDRETPKDFSSVLSELVDVIVCRTKSHSTVEQLAEFSSCPVINGLTDMYHPCQALADLLTLMEARGSLENAHLAYVGDANNVARSLAIACGQLGVKLSVGSPAGYEFDEPFLAQLRDEVGDSHLVQTNDPVETVKDADAVYSDVWASMGQESEREERAKAFAPFQVNNELMSHAKSDAVFMHCLPARRGEEVTDEVIDSSQSVVVQQAANRMHAQKGLLVWLLT